MSEWVETTLGEVTARRTDFTSVGLDTNYTILGVQRSGWGFVRHAPKRGRDQKFTKLMRVRKDDLVYRTITAFEAPSAVVGEAEEGLFVTPQTFPVFRLDRTRVLPDYMRLLTTWTQFHHEMAERCTGTVLRRKTLSITAFASIPICLPPLAEQRHIVDVMDAVDVQIEALTEEVESLQRVVTLLREEVPEADESPLSDILRGIDTGKSVQTRGEAPRVGDARVLKLSAVRPGHFNAEEAKSLDDLTGYSDAHLVADGDLLVTRANTPERVGYVAVARSVPARTYMSDLIWRARVDPDVVTADYLGHLLSSPYFRARITALAGGTSTSMVKINKKNFGAIRVPVPSIEEQENYVRTCGAASHTAADVQFELIDLRTFRSTLLVSLLSREVEIAPSYDAILAASLEGAF